MTRILRAAIDVLSPSSVVVRTYSLAENAGKGRSALEVNPDTSGRQVHPDALGSLRVDTRQRLRDRRRYGVRELNERRAVLKLQESVAHQLHADHHRLGDERQTGHHRRCRLTQLRQRLIEI